MSPWFFVLLALGLLLLWLARRGRARSGLPQGRVIAANPSYDHGFGAPLPELIDIGGEVRAILAERGPGK